MKNLTKREHELLNKLQEECAEVILAVAKIRTFGFQAKEYDNFADLEQEVGDVLGVLSVLSEEEFFEPERLIEAGKRKVAKLEEYLINKRKETK